MRNYFLVNRLSVDGWLGSIIEGTKECLERLQMDYVDVIFAHRADNTGMLPLLLISANLFGLISRFYKVPMEEIVRAFNYVIEKGWVSGSLAPQPRMNRK